MNVRRFMVRTTVAVVALTLAAGTVVPATAARTSARTSGSIEVGVSSQIASSIDTSQCLTYVAAEEVPMAVMLPCNPDPTGEVQKWTLTAKGELKVSLSQSVGGEVAATGACLDTGAGRVTVPAQAPVLVLPCSGVKGQQWTFDAKTGALVNIANGQALSSMLGLAKQARPVGMEKATGSSSQAWEQIPIPEVDLLEAIKMLLAAILDALGLDLPLPIEQASHDLYDAIHSKEQVPDQMQVLPEQMLEYVR